jgi:hypothetical protein
VDHQGPKDLRRRTEIIPIKDSHHTRIKPLALASGHGRYIAVTPERELVSVGKCVDKYPRTTVRMKYEYGNHVCAYTSGRHSRFKVNPSCAKCPGSGTEIIPGEHSDTRIKPLPLTNGHGRYMTVTTERKLLSVGE